MEIIPHKSLNYSKGVIKSHELKGTTEQEMIDELNEQGVTEAKNIIGLIKKKSGNNFHQYMDSNL